MRILVTGGAGRLGRSVVAVLAARGHEVVSADVAPAPEAPARTDGVIRLTADLLDDTARGDLFAQVRPEAVVHLAGIAVPFARPDTEILDVNTRLAWAVLSAAAEHGARSATAASSPTVFGYGTPDWRPRYLPLDEAHPRAPRHSYGLSKLIIEETARTLARAGAAGCTLTCVRPGYVIAPEEWAGAPTQQGHTVAERLRDPGLSAVALFNYVDARDAAELFALLCERPEAAVSGEVFHAIAEDALALAPLAELLPRFHPGTAPHAAALTGRRAAFSARAAAERLGWRPARTWRTELREPLPEAP
ncbi:NAD-dependent epimerase/dehydratase family protein [Streptomonospora nanhaiensis]|uniref:Nucleoside-diphosphate-sugar epimerase n=1 Tax=Streptomonospora nanhaiensis TaxID=1323731 RepID=A0A853BGQ1_9ACTN|nr:NAD-dependent epimerase/dehydratase family protein [Streptomonospora nanhaiensis]MBV2365049.1 NAD-dependent epimerase/dehydratase family protein [Streptomonospora nanhaiensis]MBX9388282.1 NAD-dependent epimerase/dehydratase family protein [Streptomonospora nanhaiensis]NYI94493.1 nucleoside-diphosphate-sugar epimerase [Streptomonospora nanhaiensis]